jgi:hypothetical protein
MNTEVNKVLCTTDGCGNLLDFHELTCLSFPDDLIMMRDILKHGVDRLYCKVCDSFTQVTGNAVAYVFEKVGYIIVYEPGEYGGKYPDFRQKLETEYGPGFTYQYYDTPEDFKFRLTAVAFKSVFPFYEQFFHHLYGEDKEEMINWMVANYSKMDKEFFAITYLIQENVIPYLVLVSDSQAAFQDRESLRELARAFQMVIGVVVPEAQTDLQRAEIEKEIRERIDDQIEQSIVFYTILLALQLEKSKDASRIDELIRQLFPKDLFNEKRIARLSQLSEGYEDDESFKPLFRYCLQAIIASMCHYAGLENPDQRKWAMYYMSFEWARYINPDGPLSANTGASPDLARQTLLPEQAWNFYAGIVNEAYKEDRIEDVQAANVIAGKIFSQLDWEEQFLDFFTKGLQIGVDFDLEKEADFYIKAIRRGEGGREVVRIFLRERPDRGIDDFVQLVQLLRQKLTEAAEYNSAVWVACRASEELNLRSAYRLSREELETCEAELQKLNVWPPEDKVIYIDFLTEFGNSLRYAGQPASALEKYDLCKMLMDVDYTVHDFRTNERNRAIVLREMLQIGDSLTILESLMPYADTYSERAMMLTSMSVCYQLLGQSTIALQLLKETVKILPPGQTMERERLLPLLSMASLAQSEEPQTAFDAAMEVVDIASRQKHAWAEALAYGLAARSAEDLDMPDEQRQEINTTAIKVMKEYLSPHPEGKAWYANIRDLVFRGLLAERLEAAGDLFEAEKILKQAVDELPAMGDEQAWAVYANLSKFALMRQDLDQARKYLSLAKISSTEMTSRLRSNNDPINLMSDKTLLQYRLAEVFLASYPEGVTDEDLRSAADFQTSVVFSSNLFRKMKLEYPALEEDLFYKDSYLASSILDKHTAIAQVISTTDYLFLLITKLVDGKAVLSLSLLAITPQIKDQMVREVAFKLSVARPKQMQDPLQKVKNWQAFIDSVDSAFRDHVPPQSHICLIPGPLSGLPLHYGSADEYTFSYAPSLATICLLRHERSQRLGKRHWRPRDLHDFVVWRVGENPNAVLSFQNASHALQGSLQRHAMEYTASMGVEGTEQNLTTALKEKDCVKISCHGRAKVDSLRFELLVAASGQLPPQDARALDSELGEQFLLNWNELEGISRSSPLVFSTACASGMAVSVTGGERLGLERYLFNAGTLCYVAPQWPVPIEAIQTLMNRIIETYFDCSDLSVSEIIYNLLKSPPEEIPGWVMRSIILIGDWL